MQIIGVGAAILAALGSLMPWMTAGENIAMRGTDGDGAYTLALAVVAGLLFFAWGRRASSGGTWVAVVAGLLGAGILAIAVSGGVEIAQMESPYAIASIEIGTGIYVTAVGGVGLVIAGIVAWKQERSSGRRRGRPSGLAVTEVLGRG